MKNLPVFLLLLCAVIVAAVLHSRTVAVKQEAMDELGPAMKQLQPSLQPGGTIALWNTTHRSELLPWCRFLLTPVVIKDYTPGQPADTILAIAGKGDAAAAGIIAAVAGNHILQQYADSNLSYTLLRLTNGTR